MTSRNTRSKSEHPSNGAVTSSTFDKHTTNDNDATANSRQKKRGLTWMGNIAVFLIFPSFVGVLGLYISYLETKQRPDKKLDFDRDFVMPFLLALAMVVVIGIQSNGFTGKAKPLVQWPKVRRVKKIVHRSVDSESTTTSTNPKKNE